MKDAPLQTCPKEKCGQKKWGKGRVKRVLSGGAGLLFKGSGFYTTDYRSEGYKQAAKKDSESAAPKSEAAGTAKKEAKAEKPSGASAAN
jgi:predicted nucleic acid-binding Zn ribbon protein